MAKEVKLKVLEIKSLTHYLVKEVDSKSAIDFLKLEEVIQKTYSSGEDCRSKQDLDVGSYVCVNLNPEKYKRRAPKKWLRAVVRNILITIGTYLFDVYLLDYGIQKMVKRTEVRELRPHFGDEFVKFQVMNFHLSDTELKPDVNNDRNRQLVEELLLKSNDSLVSAHIIKETNTNLLGTIKLNDDSDMNQFLIEKELAVEKVFEIRKPKTIPIFKTIGNKLVSNSVQLNGEYLQSSTDTNSISSVSSAEISIGSNSSIESIDIDSSGQDVITNSKVVNGINGMKGGKPPQMYTRIKLYKQMQQMMSSNAETLTTDSSDRSESPVDYVSHFNSKPVDEPEVDWPQLRENRPVIHKLHPAGILPPPHVIQRIYTLKQKY